MFLKGSNPPLAIVMVCHTKILVQLDARWVSMSSYLQLEIIVGIMHCSGTAGLGSLYAHAFDVSVFFKGGSVRHRGPSLVNQSESKVVY